MSDGRWERELVNALREDGMGAVRMPSSGSATKAALPDIMAGRPSTGLQSVVWNIELKATRDERIYVPKDEVQALNEFTRIFGGQSFIGARFIDHYEGQEVWLVTPSNLRTTEKNYVVEKTAVQEQPAWRVDCTDGVVEAHMNG
jgi:Holliday junction resolvase